MRGSDIIKYEMVFGRIGGIRNLLKCTKEIKASRLRHTLRTIVLLGI